MKHLVLASHIHHLDESIGRMPQQGAVYDSVQLQR